MSAVFQLDFSGEPTPCDFPGCVLDSFHDGEHEFASAPKPAMGKAWEDVRKCVVCGTRFVIYSETFKDTKTCSSGCMLILAMKEAAKLEVSCPCAQRSYPHELRIHTELRGESYNPKHKFTWPWSLMLSQREEPSTERKQS
jgi:hypothetical protein